MRHRISNVTGLGNPAPEMLDNKGHFTKAMRDMAYEAIQLYFWGSAGIDFKVEKDSVRIGIEPAYQGGRLKMIEINRDKEISFIVTGIARGAYGSELCVTNRMYLDYKYKCKFTKFIDKWHPKIFTPES